ncbi:MAG: sulfatase-like hydrolase/transferase [Pirellulales bacterium]
MRTICLVFIAYCTVSWCCGDRTAGASPNIVVFLADDYSQADSGPYGCRDLRTPQIDALAARGMTFDRAYVASPSCAPSRAALLTGLFPARNGAQANHAKPAADLKKWPAYFQELGYETAAFGKVSHYGHTSLYGFDHFAHDAFHDPEGIPAAVNFLKQRSGSNVKPLCLMVGSNWPHVPWPEKFEGIDPDSLHLPDGSIDTPQTRRWRARYATAVERLDQELGEVMHAVDEYLPDDTVFIFSADHGSQWPFAKWNLYEAGIRVPLIVAQKNSIQAASRSDALVSWVDFLPTCVDLAGGTTIADIDGRSFKAVLQGNAKEHRELIFATHLNDNRMNVYPSRSLQDKRWKYIRNLHPEYAFTTHIDLVAGRLGQRDFFRTWEEASHNDPHAAELLKRYHARPAEELYDLTADPTEQRNVAGLSEHAADLRRLRSELDRRLSEQRDNPQIKVAPRLLSDPKSFGPAAEVND